MSVGKILSASAAGPGELLVRWDDGARAIVRLAQLIASRVVLAPLALPAEFDGARLGSDGWSVEWPSGIDFGAPQLRRWAEEQESLEAANPVGV